MKIPFQGVASIAVMFAVSGCANWNGFNRSRNMAVGENIGQAVFVDAKQRAFYLAPVASTTTTYRYDPNGSSTVEATTSKTWLRFCAEPSPDAVSALAASASGSLNAKEKLQLGAAMSVSEAVGSIGLRTQSIQLMRDAQYRICEGAASGMLSPMQYETMQRRYQSSMVAILAIEQLTGAVRGPSVLLSGSSSVTGGDAVAALPDKVVAARNSVATAEAGAATAKKAAEDKKAAADAFLTEKNVASADALSAEDRVTYDAKAKESTDAAAASKAANDKLTTAKADLANYEAAIASVGKVGLSSSVVATGSQPSVQGDAIASVAANVTAIVNQTLNLGFLREGCATLIVATAEGRSAVNARTDPLAASCKAYFDATVAQLEASNDATRANTEFVRMITVVGAKRKLTEKEADAVKQIAAKMPILDAPVAPAFIMAPPAVPPAIPPQ